MDFFFLSVCKSSKYSLLSSSDKVEYLDRLIRVTSFFLWILHAFISRRKWYGGTEMTFFLFKVSVWIGLHTNAFRPPGIDL